jgi:hypothetical protein
VGGAINVTNTGQVQTTGGSSIGIFAQSVGGGGGVGGDSNSQSSADKGTVSLAVGGNGGGGGNGGAVSVTNSGLIVTSGASSFGIYAESVGGGGGDGGSATTSSKADPAQKSVAVSVAIGGAGGIGGDGGAVTTTNNGALTTFGNGAIGIFVQSVGGGGGTGGNATSTSEAKFTPSVSVGGSGGTGGVGGAVSLTNNGIVTTVGNDAIAVFAQSVGGGGGLGGSAGGQSMAADNPNSISYAVSVGVGGTGGTGGNGGGVTITNNGLIATFGVNSYGVLAQSVGGGGGIGGGATSKGDDASYTLKVSVGGSGGTAGSGGAVNVTNAGNIGTVGGLSYGIYGLSVGGGGGIGGDASSEAASGNSKNEKGSISLALGGSGGAAGDGGAVTISNIGKITTLGFGAHGVFAQSVGGGGGSGAAGDAEGSGNVNVGAGFGGSGGASGNGSTVQVTNAGSIATGGNDAYGIFAQSIGGGGGAGFGDAGSGNGQGAGAKSISISVGGAAGGGGNGGAVTATQTGNIVTLGIQSFGIFAQSVGGGGGVGGAGQNNTGLSVAVGGSGGSGGNGGNVAVSLTGNITTAGDGAHGIFAQSVGGGGGVGGDVNTKTIDLNLVVTTVTTKVISIGAGVTGSGGNGGNGGAVNVTSSGIITTFGQDAFGILAQSVGGGGGYSGTNNGSILTIKIGSGSGSTGSGGAVTVNYTGSVFALGADSHAIFAQSTGPSGAGNISVTVAGGSILGGMASGAGIYLDGGNANTVAIGTGAFVSALSGQAIVSTGGNNTVNNSGIVSGNVRIGGGVNAFNNLANGTFVTGSTIDLGSSGNSLTNAGLLDIGGTRSVATTALKGQFTQAATGTTAVDVRLGSGPSDLLTVSGTATLNGFVKPTILSLMPNKPVTILTATGALTNAGVTAINTPFITYGLDFNNIGGPGALVLTVAGVNFSNVPALSGNQRSLASYFQNIYASGGSPALAEAMGYLVSQGTQSYTSALDHLHPSAHLVQASRAIGTGLNFTNAMLSCPGIDGPFAAIREHECTWLNATTTATSQSSTAEFVGFHELSERFQAGRQIKLSTDWFLAFSGGYEQAAITLDNAANAGASRLDVGAAMKHVMGPWLLSAALDFGYAWFNTSRLIGFPAPNLTATSNSNLVHLDGKVRGAYLIEAGIFYAKPMLDADLIYTYMPGFSENGAGALGLNVNSLSDVTFVGTPALELGATFERGGHYFRPHLSLGASFLSHNSLTITANLQGAPSGTAPFATTFGYPGIVGKVSAGLDVLSPRDTPAGFDVRLQYDGQFGDGYQSHAGTAKVSFHF